MERALKRPNVREISPSSGKGQCDTEGEAVSKIREESKVQGWMTDI